jgi:hypothetical protein
MVKSNPVMVGVGSGSESLSLIHANKKVKAISGKKNFNVNFIVLVFN